MAERPVKRLRQEVGEDELSYNHISETNDTGESSDDWQPQTPSNSRIVSSTGGMLRPQRASGGLSSSAVTVSRSPSSPPEETKRSIRLTVKMPSSKLREVTSADARPHNIFTEPVVIFGPRSSRSKKKIVEVDSDEDEDIESLLEEDEEDEDDEDDDENDDAEASEDPDADAEGDEDLDAEGEPDPDVDAEGDIDMDDAPPVSRHPRPRPAVTVTPAAAARVRNVESRNVNIEEDDEDEEELSELDSEVDAEKGDDTILPEAGDEDEEEVDEEDEENEAATPMEASRASSPSYSNRKTKRQRERLELGDFLQLPMEPQVKKHLTAEEHAMRRAEMARRRKNLSEKRNEEEKMDTINKLLKKQAPKRRGKISAAETAGDASPRAQDVEELIKPEPTMVRYVMNCDGCRLGVPDEWFGAPAGQLFEYPTTS
ncbi:hypothetical protein LOZ58_002413 [Ophidiomyces ophidiicola]|nr:hypothetical protein LOZ66_004264 [Ophidiomyces ophidiicola]KAI1962793.1 hypothetical protein LOZ58_002413 [Ophidiomyces ophidiicola]